HRNPDAHPARSPSPTLPSTTPTTRENPWANDTDRSALAAQPGHSQGRPPNSRAPTPILESALPTLRSPAGPESPVPRTSAQPRTAPSECIFMPRRDPISAKPSRRLSLHARMTALGFGQMSVGVGLRGLVAGSDEAGFVCGDDGLRAAAEGELV